MNESYIITRGVPENDLKIVLMDFAKLYSDNHAANGLRLYRKQNGEDAFLILFTNFADFSTFSLLVNYLNYPKNHGHFHPFLRGFYLVNDIEPKGEYAVGEWVMVYVSRYNKAYGNVNFVNINNKNYLYDFGPTKIRKLKTPEEKFNLELPGKDEYSHVADIVYTPAPPTLKEPDIKQKPWWKFWQNKGSL